MTWLRRLRDAWQAWVCERTHPHVITWDTADDRSMTVLYVQCTDPDCRRRSPGISIESPRPGHGKSQGFVLPSTSFRWWQEHTLPTYLDHQAGETKQVVRMLIRQHADKVTIWWGAANHLERRSR